MPLHPYSAGNTSGNPSSSSPPSSRDASSFTALLACAWCLSQGTDPTVSSRQHPLQPCVWLRDSHKLMRLGLNSGSCQQHQQSSYPAQAERCCEVCMKHQTRRRELRSLSPVEVTGPRVATATAADERRVVGNWDFLS